MSWPDLGAKRAPKLLTTNQKQEQLLNRYAEAVVHAPINLTSETDKAIFRQRHVEDAVALSRHIAVETKAQAISKVLDVGSGNGIPGLVLAILHPEWQISLLDSSNKKCLFLDMFIKNNAIENATVECVRAEELARAEYRESYDLVVCRALEKLPTALELTLPFLKKSGYLIVSHGTSWQEELQRAENGLKILGGTFKKAVPYSIEGTMFYTLIFEKMAVTPERYPRNVGIPTKRPL
jgi:16S rRNA (guanine527-N7)-methyltransferase